MEYTIPISINSSATLGATLISEGKDKFTISNQNGLFEIPREAKVATVELNNATVWNTIYNISSNKQNNKFRFTELGTDYDVTFSDGLYDLSALNTALNRELTAQGLASGIVTLQGDDATQKVVVIWTTLTQSIDFTIADSCRTILGFDSAVYSSGAVTPGYTIAPNSALFNLIDYYLINSDLVTDGIMINGKYQSVISKMPIQAPVGSQSVYIPYNPIKTDISNRIGTVIQKMYCYITDQNGGELELTDDWSFDIIVRYQL